MRVIDQWEFFAGTNVGERTIGQSNSTMRDSVTPKSCIMQSRFDRTCTRQSTLPPRPTLPTVICVPQKIDHKTGCERAHMSRTAKKRALPLCSERCRALVSPSIGIKLYPVKRSSPVVPQTWARAGTLSTCALRNESTRRGTVGRHGGAALRTLLCAVKFSFQKFTAFQVPLKSQGPSTSRSSPKRTSYAEPAAR